MSGSITVVDGKFAVYRTDDSSGAVPYANIKAAEDGGCAEPLIDFTGKVWLFYTVANGSNYDLKYYRSTDTIGTAWGSSTLIKATVKQGVPGREQLATGRIIVYYWKDDGGTDKFYMSKSDDWGATWTESEVTTA